MAGLDDMAAAAAAAGAAEQAANGGDQAGQPRPGRTVATPSPQTLRLYAADWVHFAAWCRREAVPALPATPATLATYLTALAPTLSRGALGRRRSAIAATHRQHGLPEPKLDPARRAAVRNAARLRKAVAPSPQPTSATLERMAVAASRDLAGLRDRAMLLLAVAIQRVSGIEHGGRGQGIPRVVLLGLDAEHVRFTAGGADLQLREKADETEPSTHLVLARTADHARCPVRALEEWLRASDTTYGPVFRKVTRWGGVEHGRLGPDAWRRILARHTSTHA